MVSNKKSKNSTKKIVLLASLVLLSSCGGGSGDHGSVSEINLPTARGLEPAMQTHLPDFNGEHHSGSAQCSTCHNNPQMTVQGDAPGERRNVSIGVAWETSIMAQATRDPYWHAAVASELYNFPQLEDTINDKCVVCHAPAAYDLAAKEDLDLRLFDKIDEQSGEVLFPGIYGMDSSNTLFNHAMDGVTCTLCHQLESVNFGTNEGMSGKFVVTGSPSGLKNERPAYGQYANDGLVAGYMQQQSEFQAQQGLHLSTSESCATCHNLEVASVDSQGNPVEMEGHFSEQAIYTEWQQSDYAVGGPEEASCQDCHMPVVNEDVIIAEGADIKRPDFAEHTFLGANTVMMDMFKNYAEQLGIDPDLDFDSAIERNQEFLKTSADLTLVQGSVEAGKLNFDVSIENHTGHRLPSGYHSRRVFVHVQVLDVDGELVFESGRMRPDGSIVGVSEDVNPATWEPHYDLITEPTQVQVYQAITGDSDGDRTHSLLAASFYLKDNRLTPSGFDKQAVASDTTLPATFGVFGEAIDDEDFNSGRDVVSYQVDIPDSGIFTVIAALRYQPLNYGHLQQMWTEGDHVDQVDMFRTIYNGTTRRAEYIATDTLVMQ